MKAEIVTQPIDRSTDEEGEGTEVEVRERSVFEEWVDWGRERFLVHTTHRQDNKSRCVEPTRGMTKRRGFWMVAIFSCLLLVVGMILALVLLTTTKEKDSDKSNANRFDFTNTTTTTTAPQGTLTDATTVAPTTQPVEVPTSTLSPTMSPTNVTTSPTIVTASPTIAPTTVPTTTMLTLEPTVFTPTTPTPTQTPAKATFEPTLQIGNLPAYQGINDTSATFSTFCVIADVPYSNNEANRLRNQIATQLDDCEFLVHLGDILQDVACTEARYLAIKDILLESPIPAFILPGDNEWNDCGSAATIDAAWGMWENHLMELENHWNHTFQIVRKIDRPENFYFLHQRTLLVGLNIVGGTVHNATEWSTRLSSLYSWLKQVVALHVPEYASGVIVMAHAELKEDHRAFSDNLRRLVRDEWGNQIPFLYLHGDGHAYRYRPNYLNQTNFMSIQSEGGTRNPILKIRMDPHGNGPYVENAFQVDRQL